MNNNKSLAKIHNGKKSTLNLKGFILNITYRLACGVVFSQAGRSLN